MNRVYQKETNPHFRKKLSQECFRVPLAVYFFLPKTEIRETEIVLWMEGLKFIFYIEPYAGIKLQTSSSQFQLNVGRFLSEKLGPFESVTTRSISSSRDTLRTNTCHNKGK